MDDELAKVRADHPEYSPQQALDEMRKVVCAKIHTWMASHPPIPKLSTDKEIEAPYAD